MLKMKILVSSLLFLLMLGAMGSSYGQPGCVEGEVGCALEENAVSGEKRPQSSLTGQPPLVSPAIYQKAYQLGGFLGDGSRFAPKGRVRQSAGRARFQVNVNGMVGFSQRHEPQHGWGYEPICDYASLPLDWEEGGECRFLEWHSGPRRRAALIRCFRFVRGDEPPNAAASAQR